MGADDKIEVDNDVVFAWYIESKKGNHGRACTVCLWGTLLWGIVASAVIMIFNNTVPVNMLGGHETNGDEFELILNGCEVKSKDASAFSAGPNANGAWLTNAEEVFKNHNDAVVEEQRVNSMCGGLSGSCRPTRVVQVDDEKDPVKITDLLNNVPCKEKPMTVKYINDTERKYSFFIVQLLGGLFIMLSSIKEISNFPVLVMLMRQKEFNGDVLIGYVIGFLWYMLFPGLLMMLSFLHGMQTRTEIDLFKDSLAFYFLLEANDYGQFMVGKHEFEVDVESSSEKEALEKAQAVFTSECGRVFVFLLLFFGHMVYLSDDIRSSWDFFNPLTSLGFSMTAFLIGYPMNAMFKGILTAHRKQE